MSAMKVQVLSDLHLEHSGSLPDRHPETDASSLDGASAAMCGRITQDLNLKTLFDRRAVSARVNSARNDDPELLVALDA